jgi:hypothetical protein
MTWTNLQLDYQLKKEATLVLKCHLHQIMNGANNNEMWNLPINPNFHHFNIWLPKTSPEIYRNVSIGFELKIIIMQEFTLWVGTMQL